MTLTKDEIEYLKSLFGCVAEVCRKNDHSKMGEDLENELPKILQNQEDAEKYQKYVKDLYKTSGKSLTIEECDNLIKEIGQNRTDSQKYKKLVELIPKWIETLESYIKGIEEQGLASIGLVDLKEELQQFLGDKK